LTDVSDVLPASIIRTIALVDSNQYIFTLNTATALYAGTLDNFTTLDAAHCRKLKLYAEIQACHTVQGTRY
jgi:hypothetical protein